MARLTTDKLRGIWAGATMTWDEKYRFDEETYAKNIRRLIDSKVHGIYTTGSTGEFYAVEYDEFCRMVDIQAELCGKAKMPLQIGCCSDTTSKTIKLLEYTAAKKEVSAAQVVLPYWMELSDREVLQFFKDLHTACPDLPLVHYNIPRAKRFLTGEDYVKILDVVPNLIGVKFTFAGTHFGQLQRSIIMTPHIAYFVAEDLLASAMQLGARGCYSSLVMTNPAFMLELYNLADTGQWDKAVKMQQQASSFFTDVVEFVQSLGEHIMDPLFDKALAVASGFALGHQRCRPPYISFEDQTVTALRDWLKTNYPQFIYPI